MSGVTVKPVVLEEPLNIDELTQTVLDGTGVLDTLLKTMRTHLDVEFKAGRLRGPDYATAYIGSYTATMQTAVQYALAKVRLGYELELLQAQVTQADAQNRLTEAQAAAIEYETKNKAPIEVANLGKQGSLLDAQLNHAGKETELLSIQITKATDDLAKTPIELELLRQQVSAAEAQTGHTQKQAEMVAAQTSVVEYELANKAPVEVANLTKQGELLEAQVQKAEDELLKSPVELAILTKQSTMLDTQQAHALKETEMLTLQLGKVPEEIELLKKQIAHSESQTDQVQAQTDTIRSNANKIPVEIELLNKQKAQADSQLALTAAQKAQVEAQTSNVAATTANVQKQGLQIEAQTAQVEAQTQLVEANIEKAPAEKAHVEAQTQLVTKQAQKLDKDVLLQAAQIELAYAQIDLSKAELDAKLKQLDLLKAQIAGQEAQSALYAQKVITERAQTDSTVIGTGSVLSVQNQMIKAQTDGFRRDAEQKAAKIFVDTWSVRRNTDNGVSGNSDNYLNDATIGAVLTALLAGIGVSPKS